MQRKTLLELDTAIRRACVQAEDLHALPRLIGLVNEPVLQAVVAILEAPEPTVDDVVAAILKQGGIMRLSEFATLPNGKLVSEKTLREAYRRLAVHPDATPEQRRSALERA